MSKVLSLIVPVYNMEKYLRQCLDSVCVSNMEDLYEVLLINDGSKDSSLEIAKEYEVNYPNIFRVFDKANGGYGSCFNVGVKHAEGKYVKMLDSDDFFDANAFAEYLGFLTNCNSDAVLNDVIQYDDSNQKNLGSLCVCDLTSQGMITSINGNEYRNLFIHNFSFRRGLLLDVVCPEKVLYTDTVILFGGLLNSESMYSSGIKLYYYRIGRSGQSADSFVSLRHYKDYKEVLLKLDATFHKIRPRCSCDGFLIRCMNNVYYHAVCGLLARPSSKDIYSEYKKIRKLQKRYLKDNHIGLLQVDGIIPKTAFLPSVAYYCLGLAFKYQCRVKTE